MIIRFLETSAVILSLLWLYVIGAPVFGKIEGYLLPVANLHVEISDYDGELVMLGGHVEKHRSCVWLGNRAYQDSATERHRIRIVYDDRVDDGQDQSRPTGSSSFGPWYLHMVEPGERVIIESVHQCHALWKTVTVIAEIDP